MEEPEHIEISVCLVCGRRANLIGHFTDGVRCPGIPEKVTYVSFAEFERLAESRDEWERVARQLKHTESVEIDRLENRIVELEDQLEKLQRSYDRMSNSQRMQLG